VSRILGAGYFTDWLDLAQMRHDAARVVMRLAA
jgi:hypothetical protein